MEAEQFTQRMLILEAMCCKESSMHLFHLEHKQLVEDLQKEPDTEMRKEYCFRLLKLLNKQMAFAQGRMQAYEKMVQGSYATRMQ